MGQRRPSPDELPDLPPEVEAELDDLAEITAEDIERARAWWKRHAPAGWKELLDAGIDRGEADNA